MNILNLLSKSTIQIRFQIYISNLLLSPFGQSCSPCLSYEQKFHYTQETRKCDRQTDRQTDMCNCNVIAFNKSSKVGFKIYFQSFVYSDAVSKLSKVS